LRITEIKTELKTERKEQKVTCGDHF